MVEIAAAQGEVKLLQTLGEQIDPKVTALLVIDMQNDYIADKGKLGKLGLNPKGSQIEKAVPAMNRLIDEARNAGVMIIWIRQTHSLRDVLPNYVTHNIAKIEGRPFKEEDFLVQEGSWGAELYEKMIAPLTGEIEVIKNAYGAFTNTNIETYLKARGIRTLIYIGCALDVCVLCTAIQGWHSGYYSIIPPDCILYFDESFARGILEYHRKFYGYTPESRAMIDIWKGGK
jgi:ureidoacrylate peracid hydrolase